MSSIKLGNHLIDDDSLPFFIAEVGSNHQGSTELCKELILGAKEAGASAVKLQKRENKTFYSKDLYNEPYNNPNSFAPTYGEHRDYLDLTLEQWKDLIEFSKENEIILFSTAFDIASAEFLENLNMPIYKIPSGGLKNIPLIKHVASFGKPVIVSTGGGTIEDVDRVINETKSFQENIVLLQCTAGYPVAWEDLNLKVIETYRERFQNNVIGLSSHDNGIAMTLVAYLLGARVIEKHFTLNRANKGTDNSFSLEPQGFRKMIRDIERAKISLGDGVKRNYESEKEPLRKMATSIRASKDLPKDHKIKEEDLVFRAPDDGLAPYEINNLIGKKLKNSLSVDQLINFEDLK
mgnify:CR=1 FL=1|tara:strand:- start:993 stop:2039 length:1047 start_codon:yes stop_codon:yes gene_type:complete